MRLPYAPSAPPEGSPESADIYARIAARRTPRPLIPLDLTLLHAPPVADGYNSFVGALRTQTIISPGLLELAICRVAILNQAVYEWNIHAPLALKAAVSPEALEECFSLPVSAGENRTHVGNRAWVGSRLNAVQRAVLLYTDQMTKTVAVEDEAFVLLAQAGLSDREIVELTATIAGYNCVSRILVSLDVGENNGRRMKRVEELVAEI
ncbi:AhpD-like protein [Aspergillus karnatakaensis]|uniref:carboxymuconolactone decarboxylase family protein n=1 Tax=Aspergillus karnatakaensis TaxID=1810916 RepID=UPI003CCD444F